VAGVVALLAIGACFFCGAEEFPVAFSESDTGKIKNLADLDLPQKILSAGPGPGQAK